MFGVYIYTTAVFTPDVVIWYNICQKIELFSTYSDNLYLYLFIMKYATITDRFYRSQTFRIYVKPLISSQFQTFRDSYVMMRLHMDPDDHVRHHLVA